MCCVNRSDSAVFPPELQPCSRQTLTAQGRERENEKKKGSPAHHHGCSMTDAWPRWKLLQGCCSCEANLRPDHHTCVFRALTDFQIWKVCLFCSARVCTSFACSPGFVVSRGPGSAGFTTVALVLWFLDLHLFPLNFLFWITKSGKWRREEEWGRFWAKHPCDYPSINAIGQDRPPCSLCILQFLYEINM